MVGQVVVGLLRISSQTLPLKCANVKWSHHQNPYWYRAHIQCHCCDDDDDDDNDDDEPHFRNLRIYVARLDIYHSLHIMAETPESQWIFPHRTAFMQKYANNPFPVVTVYLISSLALCRCVYCKRKKLILSTLYFIFLLFFFSLFLCRSRSDSLDECLKWKSSGKTRLARRMLVHEFKKKNTKLKQQNELIECQCLSANTI